MVGTIVYISLYTKYREACNDTGLSSLLDTFANGWDVLLRNSTTDNGGCELECLLAVWIHWSEVNLTMSVLSTTTGLLSVLRININSLSDCLLVCNLRCTNISLNLELTKKSVYDNLKMKLTHTCDDCLSCFLICMCSECRILFSKLC